MSSSRCYLRRRRRKDRAFGGILHREQEPAAEAHADHPPQNACPSSLACFAPSFTAHSSAAISHGHIQTRLLTAEYLHRTDLRALCDSVCLARGDACDLRTVAVVDDAHVAAFIEEKRRSQRGTPTGPALRGRDVVYAIVVQLLAVVQSCEALSERRVSK